MLFELSCSTSNQRTVLPVNTISSPSSPSPGFKRLRPPVLGLVVEEDEGTGFCRLVAADNEVLFEGARGSCGRKLGGELKARHGTGNVNVPFPTLGGKQLWGDVFFQGAWRIQENALTGHHRLLDTGDKRRAWGTYEACRVAFEEARLREGIRPRSERLV